MRIITSCCIATLLSSCSPDNKWYDYGNGIINLNLVSIVRNEGSLTITAQPNMKPPTDTDSTEAALYRAHYRFCSETAPLETSGVKSFKNLSEDRYFLDKILLRFEDEIMKTCKLNLTGSASIYVNDFELKLQNLDVNLNEKYNQKKAGIDAKEILRIEIIIEPWSKKYDEIKYIAFGER